MLAYVFWHEPRPHTVRETYESELGTFQRHLSNAGVEGLRDCATYRVSGLPWFAAGAPAYEDWYVTDGSHVLDPLNAAAVSAARAKSHDAVAGASGAGAGALYRARAGTYDREASWVHWFAKPDEMGYDVLSRLLDPIATREGRSLWSRQMVLGPSPEFCLLAHDDLALPGVLTSLSSHRTRVAGP